MGVECTDRVAQGQEFGPIPATLTLVDPAVLVGHRTCDDPPDIHSVKLDVCKQRSGGELAEWVPYVQAARDVTEQNLEAFVRGEQLYFRATRTVEAGGELLVWYSEQYAADLGLPPALPEYHDGSSFRCPYCPDTFRYEYSLRAHMRFKCKYRHHVIMAQKSSPPLRCDVSRSSAVDSPATPSPPTQPDPVSHLAPTKRRHSDEYNADLSPKRRHCPLPATSDSETGSDAKLTGETSKAEDSRSAFQRVDRKPPTRPEQRPTLPGAPPHPLLTPPCPILTSDPLNLSERPRLPVNPYVMSGGALPRMPVSLASKMDVGSRLLTTGGANENSPLQAMTSLPLMDAKLFENNNIHGKLPYPPAAALPYLYRSANPMVEKMLHTQRPPPPSVNPLPLAQNWCAKCNATFRMTSDLVYHMRSHHKREFDPVKKKRDDKLRCDVCGETFRERHHLTRHMTSHASQ